MYFFSPDATLSARQLDEPRPACGYEHGRRPVFAHACKMGLDGIVSKRKDLALPLRPLAGLAQEQEPGVRGGAARGGGGLGQVTFDYA